MYILFLLKCTVWSRKKSKFIKEHDASGLLLEPNSPFHKILILRAIFQRYRMNEIVNKFLLAEDIFMLEMHIRQHGFIYSAGEPSTKKKK